MSQMPDSERSRRPLTMTNPSLYIKKLVGYIPKGLRGSFSCPSYKSTAVGQIIFIERIRGRPDREKDGKEIVDIYIDL